MKPASAKQHFLQMIEAKSRQLSSLSPEEGMIVMLDFYRDERADGCKIDEDGDMLLYQWGCYDWGQGEFFELNITRQFIDGACEDEDIRQLSLTCKFRPSESLRQLADGNRWCNSPEEIASFRSFVESSPAFLAVAKTKPAEVTLELQVAG
jgi:hypothetical protein